MRYDILFFGYQASVFVDVYVYGRIWGRRVRRDASVVLTVGSALYDNTRVLMFGKELIYYESFSSERPFRFEGCTRGYNGTAALSHKAGETYCCPGVNSMGSPKRQRKT